MANVEHETAEFHGVDEPKWRKNETRHPKKDIAGQRGNGRPSGISNGFASAVDGAHVDCQWNRAGD